MGKGATSDGSPPELAMTGFLRVLLLIGLAVAVYVALLFVLAETLLRGCE